MNSRCSLSLYFALNSSMNLIDIRTSLYIKPVAAMQRVFCFVRFKKVV
ncbi:hypothetical protein PRUB_a5400 [Pseudoalteromonas rubra]|uniref:Uncharacterized protein n=1 Tax=Pseudoalteromonas rubra TaxID=43658 RepID=A0A8T0CEB9_9GAMM|nr:hypothetical protein PRUB_a5400 [Pseudoalteromonas rubra]